MNILKKYGILCSIEYSPEKTLNMLQKNKKILCRNSKRINNKINIAEKNI